LQCITKKLPVAYRDAQLLKEELMRLKRIAEDLISQAVKKQVRDKGSFVKNLFFSFASNFNC